MGSKEVIFLVLHFYRLQWAADHGASWKMTKQENNSNLNYTVYLNI